MNLPAVAIQHGQEAKARLEKAYGYLDRGEAMMRSAGHMLSEAQTKCVTEWFIPFFRYIEATEMSRSRVYECLAVHKGTKTVEQVREGTARRMTKNRAMQKSSDCPSRDGQTFTIPHSSPPSALPTIEDLRAAFRYDPTTGQLFWLVGNFKGKRAGYVGYDGYWRLAFRGKVHRQHRLIFALMTGRWPHTVDHINRIKSDNRWENLRDCVQADNLRNTARHDHAKGIRQNRSGRWQAYVSTSGQQLSLGTFDLPEQAREVYETWTKTLDSISAKDRVMIVDQVMRAQRTRTAEPIASPAAFMLPAAGRFDTA